MSHDLPSWPRPHFQSGGGDAFLFYLAYGDFPAAPPPLSRGKYRCSGVPEGLKLSRYDRADHGDWLETFRQGYVWETLRRDDRALADAVDGSPSCLLLHGTVSDPPTLDYLRDAVGLLTCFLDQGGTAVYDPQVLHYWTPKEWRERLFDPASAVPRHHAVILASEEEERPHLTWFHTRGMRKFGRPDVSVRGVGPAYREAAIDLCERFIEYQALGGVVPDGQEVRVHSLPPGGTARHAGALDDPDFNNVHVEIMWPGGALASDSRVPRQE